MLRNLAPSYTNVPEVQVERANYINLEQPKDAKGTLQQTYYTSLTGMDPPSAYDDVIPDSSKQNKEASQQAQVEHGNLESERPKNVKETPQQTDYTSLTGMDPPSTYDVIPDSSKQSKEASQQAQVEHGNLESERPKDAKGTPQQTDYTSLTGMDPPSTYDVIPDCSTKQRKEEGQHERRFPLITKADSEDGESVFCTRKDWGMWLMLVIMSIVAVLALVLSIAFRVNSVCDCPNSEEFQVLQSKVDQLMASLSTTPTQMPQPAPNSQNIRDLISNINSTINSRVDAIENTRVSDNGVEVGTNYSSVISGFNPFSNCTTAIEGRCTVRAASPPNPPVTCDTFEVALNQNGTFTVDVRCIRPVATAGALLTTLIIQDNLAQCFCYAANDDLQNNVECAIEITRCSVPQTVNTELRLSPLP